MNTFPGVRASRSWLLDASPRPQIRIRGVGAEDVDLKSTEALLGHVVYKWNSGNYVHCAPSVYL